MSPKRARLLVLVAVTAIGILAGCNKESTSSSSNTAMPPPGPSGGPGPSAKAFDADSEPHSAGKKVMVASGCFRCHSVDGAKPSGGSGSPPQFAPIPGGPPPGGPGGPGRGGMGAPDLAKVAADASHTPEWLTQYIQDPKSVKADSKMPKFEGKMSEDDLKKLVEYLASLK